MVLATTLCFPQGFMFMSSIFSNSLCPLELSFHSYQPVFINQTVLHVLLSPSALVKPACALRTQVLQVVSPVVALYSLTAHVLWSQVMGLLLSFASSNHYPLLYLTFLYDSFLFQLFVFHTQVKSSSFIVPRDNQLHSSPNKIQLEFCEVPTYHQAWLSNS